MFSDTIPKTISRIISSQPPAHSSIQNFSQGILGASAVVIPLRSSLNHASSYKTLSFTQKKIDLPISKWFVFIGLATLLLIVGVVAYRYYQRKRSRYSDR